MAQLTPVQAAQLAAQAGFRGQGLVDIVAIMGRESGYNPDAYNGNAQTNDSSVGLTQINLYGDLAPSRIAMLNSLLPQDQQVSTVQQAIQALKDPAINLKMAYMISSNGTSFGPWKMSADPNSFLQGTNVAEAQKAVNALGDPTTSDIASPGGGRFGVSFTGTNPSDPFATDLSTISQALANIPSGSPFDNGSNPGAQSWQQMQTNIQQFQDLLNQIQSAGGVNADNIQEYGLMINGLAGILSAEANMIQAEGPSAQWRDWLAGLQQNLQTFQAQAAAQSSAASAYNTAQSNITTRANNIAQQQIQAAQYMAPPGKTSWSMNDMGMGGTAGFLGMNPNAPFIAATGQVPLINQQALIGTMANQMGVNGPMPVIGTNPNAQGQAGNAFNSGGGTTSQSPPLSYTAPPAAAPIFNPFRQGLVNAPMQGAGPTSIVGTMAGPPAAPPPAQNPQPGPFSITGIMSGAPLLANPSSPTPAPPLVNTPGAAQLIPIRGLY